VQGRGQESHGGLSTMGILEMNPESIPLSLLRIQLMLLLAACGVGSQIADTLIPKAKVLAQIKVELLSTKVALARRQYNRTILDRIIVGPNLVS